jgi:S-adenosylmethionine:tRNA-ribosyltransferase-isomerase (queuine synthetase)
MPPAPRHAGRLPGQYAQYEIVGSARLRDHSPADRSTAGLLAVSASGVFQRETMAALPYLLNDTVMVLNTSGTFLAEFVGEFAGQRMVVHFAQMLDDGALNWVIAVPLGQVGGVIQLPDGANLTITNPYVIGRQQVKSAFFGGFWEARFTSSVPFDAYQRRYGHPLFNSEIKGLNEMQNWFSGPCTSALMNNGGRNLTEEIIQQLLKRGVQIATLEVRTALGEHNGLPLPEWVRLDPLNAAIINSALERGWRVLPVGTSVVRALSALHDGKQVRAAAEWVNNVITPENGGTWLRSILTGLHEPYSSHLGLLAAIMGEVLSAQCMVQAHSLKMSFHATGDSLLYLR